MLIYSCKPVLEALYMLGTLIPLEVSPMFMLLSALSLRNRFTGHHSRPVVIKHDCTQNEAPKATERPSLPSLDVATGKVLPIGFYGAVKINH